MDYPSACTNNISLLWFRGHSSWPLPPGVLGVSRRFPLECLFHKHKQQSVFLPETRSLTGATVIHWGNRLGLASIPTPVWGVSPGGTPKRDETWWRSLVLDPVLCPCVDIKPTIIYSVLFHLTLQLGIFPCQWGDHQRFLHRGRGHLRLALHLIPILHLLSHKISPCHHFGLTHLLTPPPGLVPGAGPGNPNLGRYTWSLLYRSQVCLGSVFFWSLPCERSPPTDTALRFTLIISPSPKGWKLFSLLHSYWFD